MAVSDTFRGTRRTQASLIVAVVLMAIAMIGFIFIQNTKGNEERWVELAHAASINVKEVATVTDDITRGVPPAFNVLTARVDDFDATIQILQHGDSGLLGIPPAPSSVSEELEALVSAWAEMRQTADAVIAGQRAFEQTQVATATLLGDLLGDHSREGLVGTYSAILKRISSSNTQVGSVGLAADQLTRVHTMAALTRGVLSNGRDAGATAGQLNEQLQALLNTNPLLADVPGAAAQLLAARATLDNAAQTVQQIDELGPVVSTTQLSAADMRRKSVDVISAASTLEQRLLDTKTRLEMLPVVVYVSGGLALILLIIFVILNFRFAQKRLQQAEARDAKQQHAILSLLDEITNLADGDLTVDVTVTEDFTGAIADSINYTVQNMRNLVGTINQTSVQIAGAAGETRQTALKMTDDSKRQATQITAVTQTIDSASQSLQQVAANAEALASQAQQSVKTAQVGADTVNRTITGMSALREQIQDTSKRIKRLGESSQEIGTIIEFINDIAEQTNTLALNASIQAAMAGDAGRGFAVVADEVQRLAERAASATRQVEILVKTIQADTNEAIVSMERSTQNVVVGAKSAEEAGQALSQIETASQDLSHLMTDISSAARSESQKTTDLAGTIQAIREIALQTSGSATQTAEAIQTLSALSQLLNDTVAGFKLPEDTLAQL